MSQTTYATLTYCTPLVDLQPTGDSPHLVTLNWSLNKAVTDSKYSRIEIYRYIGPNGQCKESANDTDTGSKLIYTFSQPVKTDGTYENPTKVTFINNQTNVSVLLENIVITDIGSIQDDLSGYYNSGTTLRSFHCSSETTVTDKNILDDVYYTKRAMFYIIKATATSLGAGAESSPYCLASHTYTGILDCTSTKTQVRHDTLHYEGDIIWATKLPHTSTGTGTGLSRTSVDLNRVYLRPDVHGGPSGRGGYGWTSDRATGYIFRVRLNDGQLCGMWIHPNQVGNTPHGFPVVVDPNTGDCFTSTRNTSSGTLRRCVIPSENGTTPVAAVSPTAVINSNPTVVSTNPFNGAYGLVNVPQSTNTIGVLVRPDNAENKLIKYDYVAKTSTVTYNNNFASKYGIACGPDGSIFGSSLAASTELGVITPLNNTVTITKSSNPLYDNTSTLSNIGITTDRYNTWPNNVTNAVGDKQKYHVFTGGDYSSDTYFVDYTIDASTPQYITRTQKIYPMTAKAYRGFGIDSENNIWGVGTYRGKIFRMPGSNIYPIGGACRYPSTKLEEWPDSSTNTKEVEWFLLRDHTLLDNKYSVVWDPLSASMTAQAAWNSLIDDKRFELDPVTNAITKCTSTAPYSSNTLKSTAAPSGGFKTYTETSQQENTATRVYGIRMKDYANKAECIRKINLWYNAFANTATSYIGNALRSTIISNNLIGRRVHPIFSYAYYSPPTSQPTGLGNQLLRAEYATRITSAGVNAYYAPGASAGDNATGSYELQMPNWHGYSYQYSDFTGNLLAASFTGQVNTVTKSYIHPPITVPKLKLYPTGTHTGGFNDIPINCYPWNEVNNVSATTTPGTTGYDNLSVSFYVSTNPGSFIFDKWTLYTRDFYPSYLTDTGNLSTVVKYEVDSKQQYFDYTYRSPSKNGIYSLDPGIQVTNSFLVCASGSNGLFLPTVSVTAKDIYTSTCPTTSFSATAQVCVLERWPEPKFYIDINDTADDINRATFFCNDSWGVSRFTRPIVRASHSTDAKKYDTIYATDPLTGSFQDRSIARTWPISSWVMNISGNSPFSSFYTATTVPLTADVAQDTQNYFDALTSIPFRYGDYAVTMYVNASTTSTSSDKYFTQYIKVSELEPFANFWAISGYTVDATYCADTPALSSQIVLSPILNSGTTTKRISGYAPNLTVWFVESSDPHTFPIKSYQWDFGDSYNEGVRTIYDTDSNYYTVTANNVTNGTFNDTCWRTAVTNHTAVHTYIMPGTYNVTLTVEASNTQTQDVCACYQTGDITNDYYIIVKELEPICGTGIWGSNSLSSGYFSTGNHISGGTPLTAFFTASGIVAGSFPICRIDWDFGDGEIETITRIPAITATSQGIPLYSLNLYNTADPRDWVVPHVFLEQGSTIVSLSAYVCNTNTLLECSNSSLIGVISATPTITTGSRRLVNSRVDASGNLIYIFEDMNTSTLYTVALTGEVL